MLGGDAGTDTESRRSVRSAGHRQHESAEDVHGEWKGQVELQEDSLPVWDSAWHSCFEPRKR